MYANWLNEQQQHCVVSTSMYTYILIFHFEVMNLYDALSCTPPLKKAEIILNIHLCFQKASLEAHSVSEALS